MKGFLALVSKELRGLRPFIVLVTCGFIVLPLVEWLRYPIDRISLWRILHSPSEWVAFVAWPMAFGLGLSLAASEHDDGTIHFLDGLPTTRARAYAAKLVAGVLVMSIVPLGNLLWQIPSSLLSRTSVDDSADLGILLPAAAIRLVLLTCALATGLGLSMARRVAWVLLAIVATVVLQAQRHIPSIAVLKPTLVAEVRIHAGALVVPWAALATQAVIAAVLFVAGGLVFTGAGAAFAEAIRSREDSRRGRALTIVVTTALVASWIGAAAAFWNNEKSDDDVARADTKAPSGTSFKPFQPVHFITRAFDFRVGPLSPRAHRQLRAADSLADAVRSKFNIDGVAVAPGRISVEATAPLGNAAHAGQTEWKAVAIDIRELEGDDLAEIIAHETAHVYANLVTDGRIARMDSATRLFHEGLATVTAQEVTGAAPRHRRHTAFVRARDLVKSDILFETELLRARIDDLHAYSLGSELVRAMIDLYGPDAPYRFVRKMNDVPASVVGVHFMRDAAQRADMNLDRVLERFWVRLDEAVVEQKEALQLLPRTYAAVEVVKRSSLIRVHVEWDGDGPGDATPVCRIRPNPWSPLAVYRMARADDDGDCFFTRSTSYEGRIGVQVGWSFEGENAIFEPWTEVELNR